MRIFIVFLLSCLCAFGQTITGAAIETNGYVLDIYCTEGQGFNSISNFSSIAWPARKFANYSNANWPTVYALYPAAQVPSPQIVLTYTGPGFDDVGNQIYLTRTVYGTKNLRFAYPNNSEASWVDLGGGAAVGRFALSDFIFATDSNITVNIAANFISNNTSASGMTVTNNSWSNYPPCIANWELPPFQQWGATGYVEAKAAHYSAQKGRPVRMMQFTFTDAHGHTLSTNIIQMTISTNADANPVGVYAASVSVAGMTDQDPIRCDFTAFPWWGDVNAILSTASNKWKEPTALPCSITNLCDYSGNYGGAIAVVSGSGSDSTGRAFSKSTGYSGVTLPCATISQAVHNCVASNLALYGHKDFGGCVIYVNAGTYAFSGSSAGTYGTNALAWGYIQGAPGTTLSGASSAQITTASGDKTIAPVLALKGLYISNTTTICFSTTPYILTENCFINAAGTATYYGNTIGYFLWNTFSNLLQGALSPYSTQNSEAAIVRGNVFAGFSGEITPGYNVCGNITAFTNNNSTGLVGSESTSTQTVQPAFFSIIADNRFLGMFSSGGSPTLYLYQSSGTNDINRFGSLVANNVIEQYKGTTGTDNLAVQIAADETTNDCDNILFWNNTVIGGRCNIAYDGGSGGLTTFPTFRRFWSVKGNIFDACNIKSDTFASYGGASGGRIGNWPVLYDVGCSGNWYLYTSNYACFGFEFPGFNTVPTNDTAVGSAQLSSTAYSPTNFAHYINPQAFANYSSNGMGDYHLQSPVSPILNIQADWVLPFDLDGKPRGLFDPPGAFTTGNYRRGEFEQ